MSRTCIQSKIRETFRKRFQQAGIPRSGWIAHLVHPVDRDGTAIAPREDKAKANRRGEKGFAMF